MLVRDRAGADDPGGGTGGRRGRPRLPLGREARTPAPGAGGDARSGAALLAAHERGAVLAGCSAGAMILAGHAFEFRVGLVPWPLRWGAWPRVRAGRVGHPALRRVARALLRADRAAGPARLGPARASTRRRRSSVATAAGRSTAPRGSRSGGVATANASEPARRSGSRLAHMTRRAAS